MTSSSLSNDITDDNMTSSSSLTISSNMTSSSLSNDIIDDNLTPSSASNNKNDTNMTLFLNTPSKNNINLTLSFTTLSLNASSNDNNITDEPNSMNRDTENVISENGVFFTAAITAAATFPSYFKSITVLKDQIKFGTNKGSEGVINLRTNEREVRNVREAFQYVNINYIRKSDDVDNDGIEYTITISPKQPAKQCQLNKLKRVGNYLSQANFTVMFYLKRYLSEKLISPPQIGELKSMSTGNDKMPTIHLLMKMITFINP
jgi:hypothetical protein